MKLLFNVFVITDSFPIVNDRQIKSKKPTVILYFQVTLEFTQNKSIKSHTK